MIVLNSSKELIKVSDWATIISRPGFTENLDPSENTLSAIIGSYAFKDKIRCGLSNCHTPHNKGYIAATTDGRETNMGAVCGKSYFGVDFETLSRKFDADIQEKRDRDNLWAFSFKLEEFKENILDLRQQRMGGDWAYKMIRPFVEGTRELSEVALKLGEMRRTGSAILTRAREASDNEIESLEIAQGRRIQRPYVIEDRVGTIAGMDALYKENDLKTLLILDLTERIKEFERFSIDTMNRDELRRFAKWAGTTEATYDKAVESLSTARRFLTISNLQPISEVLSTDGATAFNGFLRELSTSLTSV